MQSDSVDRSILAFTSRALPQRARLAFLELENLSFITANDSFSPRQSNLPTATKDLSKAMHSSAER
jgi:hypothetical protein